MFDRKSGSRAGRRQRLDSGDRHNFKKYAGRFNRTGREKERTYYRTIAQLHRRLNATISVAYDNECAGGVAFTKRFTDQIVVENNGSKFLNSGDSGSLNGGRRGDQSASSRLALRRQQHRCDREPNQSSAGLPRRDHGWAVRARRFAIQTPVRRQANGHFAFPSPFPKLQFGNGLSLEETENPATMARLHSPYL